MRWLKRGIMGLFALALLAAIAWGFVPKPVQVDSATVSRGPLQVTVSAEGRTRVTDRFVMFAPVTGTIRRISLKPGDAVSPQTVISHLMPLPPVPLDARARAQAEAGVQAAQAALEQAQAQIIIATAEFEDASREVTRLTGLVATRTAPQDALDRATARRTAAEAAVRSAGFGRDVAGYQLAASRAALMEDGVSGVETPLLSPVAGRVLRVLRESAGPVAAGEALIELGDLAALEVVVDLLSSDAARVRPGMKARLERWGGETLSARVRLIEPFGFTKVSALGVEEQRVNVVLDLDTTPAELGDGYRVEVAIILEESVNVLKVPSGAVFQTAEGLAVFVIIDGRALRQLIDTGRANGLEYEVAGGLNEESRVIVHPGDTVKHGVAVSER